MGIVSLQFTAEMLPNFAAFLKKAESFGSNELSQPLHSFKAATVGAEGARKVFRFCGFMALEIVVVLFVFLNRGALTLYRCPSQIAPPEPRFPPSVWYYEHVYDFPIPQTRVLTTADGAPPIRSRILSREREITIATHTTPERLPAVKMTALRWSGPMVLVVLVKFESEIPTVYAALQELHSAVENEGRCRLNIQVIRESGFKDDEDAFRALYPINRMRNLALRMVTTPLFLMLDADLVPNPGLHEHLTYDEDKYAAYLQRATEQSHVLVIPAFTMVQDKSINYRESLHALPHAIEEMREAWWNGILDCFQCDVSPVSHSPTDYARFIDPAVDYPYDVTYQEGYEPYAIAAVEHFPHYDERFRGYGRNKASQVYLMAAKGMGFTVIQEGFLVELPHLPSPSQRVYSGSHKNPLQRPRIDSLYRRFKKEVHTKLNLTHVPAEDP